MLRNINLSLVFIIIYLQSAVCICSPYIIYTIEEFETPAQNIANFHNQTIPQISTLEPLETQIIFKESMNENELIQYLENFDNNCSDLDTESECITNNQCNWEQNQSCTEFSKYLFIIGDETIIDPLSISNICGNNQFSDDIYNLDFTIGRLLVNDIQDATNQINKIISYNIETVNGIWKNKLLLIADDQYNPSNPNSITEINHTLNTSNIFLKLEDKMLIQTLYGAEFTNQNDLTSSIINSINSGVGIINYIGHGTDQSLAHELILKMDRDIDLINTNNKPPIWVIGTCSFGKYIDNICMAEELMKKEDAAIAIISTTDGIPASTNNIYLNSFYNKISNYIDGYDYRLGDIFKKAKSEFQNNECTPYKFQLFGDPALPLRLHQKVEDLIIIPNNILIGDSNFININNEYNGNSYVRITAPNIITSIGNSQYEKPGSILFESGLFNDNINFYTPIDAIYNNVKLFVINEDNSIINNNFMQAENSIPLELNIDENILSDNQGPDITINYNNIPLTNNSTISPPYNFQIFFNDNLPINLSGYNFHFLKLWIDNNYSDSIILNNYPFTSLSDTSGYINISLDDNLFTNNQHFLNIEGWDILNNYNSLNININISKDNHDRIFNIFNFPNPFKDKTFFTFQMNDPQPINIKIDVLSKNGSKLITFKKNSYDASNYHVLPIEGWDGTNQYNEKLSNGTYFYHLKVIDNDGKILHNKLHNITILN
tara:strand:- start:1326 stop:3482 length:2157 start_codon:yes stop_codon:yes gene_type:complete